MDKLVIGQIEEALKNIIPELKKIKSTESKDLISVIEQALKMLLERPVSSLTGEPLFQTVLIRSVAFGQKRIMSLIFPLIQRLIMSPPVHPSFTSAVLNILRTQAENNDEALRLKITQTIMLLISSASHGDASDLIGGSFLNALVICLRLCSCKEKSVANTATAALRQLVELLMERVGSCIHQPDFQNEPAQVSQLEQAQVSHDGASHPSLAEGNWGSSPRELQIAFLMMSY